MASHSLRGICMPRLSFFGADDELLIIREKERSPPHGGSLPSLENGIFVVILQLYETEFRSF